MMYIKKNGEYVFVTHHCADSRKGQVMTDEESREFAIQTLIDWYRATGAETVRIIDRKPGQPDFWFKHCRDSRYWESEFREYDQADFSIKSEDDSDFVKVNVIVGESNKIPAEDISGLMEEYRTTGAFPRVVAPDLYCLDSDSDPDTGKPALCGSRFGIVFQVTSLIPDENQTHDYKKTDVELAALYIEAWLENDASILEPYLDKNFHYQSQWVFDELPCRREFLQYFRHKIASEKLFPDKMKVARNPQTSEVAVVFLEDYSENLLLKIKTSDGLITSAKMGPYDPQFYCINPQEELYCEHRFYIEAIMPVDKFLSQLQPMIKRSEEWRRTQTNVIADGIFDRLTDVMSVRDGDGDMSMLSILAYSPDEDINEYVVSWPLLKGKTAQVKIEKVLPWDSRIEATVICSVDDHTFAFYATDYYLNKNLYRAGETVSVDLAALGIEVEAGQNSFQFEGQEAIDFLSKLGKTPNYDLDGNVMPLTFNLSNLVSFINNNTKRPDEASFHSPLSDVRPASLSGIDFFKADIVIYRDDADDRDDVCATLYFRKDMFPEAVKSSNVQGWLWLTGCLTGRHQKDTPRDEKEYNRCGKMCAEFRNFMKHSDFSHFDDLSVIPPQLPAIKIRDGYDFDAFQLLDKTSKWQFRTYCRKSGATIDFNSIVIEEMKKAMNNPKPINAEEIAAHYDDSMNIDGKMEEKYIQGLKPALDYFTVPFTADAIMQAWLLHVCTDFMTDIYLELKQKEYIFDIHSAYKIFKAPYQYDKDKIDRVLAYGLDKLLPAIEVLDDKAVINYAYWDKTLKQLISACVTARRKGETIEFSTAETKVVAEF